MVPTLLRSLSLSVMEEIQIRYWNDCQAALPRTKVVFTISTGTVLILSR